MSSSSQPLIFLFSPGPLTDDWQVPITVVLRHQLPPSRYALRRSVIITGCSLWFQIHYVEQGAQSSPTSTTMSDSVSFHQAEETLSPAFPRIQNTGFLGSRKTVIRADPALATCFDPTDKQLYDLWAPKN